MATTKWVLDPMHSEVTFKIKHLVISTVTGSFKTFEGSVETEGDTFEGATAEFSLDVDSIDTNQEQRDGHLKGADFFDAETYPKISFKSTSITADTITGDLTIKDVTKPVTLDVEFGGTATDFYGNLKAGAIVLGSDVKLSINVQFAKQA
jgi:polyisoprenoid-binding protein YceI